MITYLRNLLLRIATDWKESNTEGVNNNTFENRKYYLSSIFLCALIITIPAFINNFPFLYVDSGTYLYNGHTNEVSEIRPILYGLFIRHISLQESLWIVVFVQALIVSWTLNRFVKTFFPAAHAFFSVLTVALLVFTSGIGVVTGMLMPDFLTPVMILLSGLLLFSKQQPLRSFILPCLILWLAIASHHSHPYILFCIIFGIGITHLILKYKKKRLFKLKRFALVAVIAILGYFTIPYLHYVRTGEFMRSKSSNIFLVGRINQMGLLKPFLDQQCEKSQYPLCDYKESIPANFLWDKASPVYKGNGWAANNESYKVILSDFFFDFHYAKKFIIKSIETISQQFFSFDLVVVIPQPRGDLLHNAFMWVLPEYIPALENSLQHKGQWSNSAIDLVQRVIVFSCFLLLLYLYFYQSNYYINPLYRNIFLFIFIGLLSNAFICGCVSMVDSRFQSRVIWLLPFYTLLLLYHLKEERETK